MVDFKKQVKPDKPLSQKTEPRQPSAIPLPPGCDEGMVIGNEPIAEIAIGEAVTGRIVEIKPVQTPTMKKPNNLITFHDEAYGRVKFWSSGALNQVLEHTLGILDMRVTIQRIEDETFKKGEGRNWRVFLHHDKA